MLGQRVWMEIRIHNAAMAHNFSMLLGQLFNNSQFLHGKPLTTLQEPYLSVLINRSMDDSSASTGGFLLGLQF